MESDAYTWQFPPSLKRSLETTAQREQASLSSLLEHIVTEWLEEHRSKQALEDEEQQRLQAAAAQTFGSIGGSNPDRSLQVRETIRTRLARHDAR